MKYISEKDRLRLEYERQSKIVSHLESVINRSLTDDEKIAIFKGDILLPIRKKVKHV